VQKDEIEDRSKLFNVQLTWIQGDRCRQWREEIRKSIISWFKASPGKYFPRSCLKNIQHIQKKNVWQNSSNVRSSSLASTRLWVQAPVPPKECFYPDASFFRKLLENSVKPESKSKKITWTLETEVQVGEEGRRPPPQSGNRPQVEQEGEGKPNRAMDGCGPECETTWKD
jgi:hypothetical protein